MYTVIHMQDPGSVRVNQDHGSLASRVGSRVSVADPVPSLPTVSRRWRAGQLARWLQPRQAMFKACGSISVTIIIAQAAYETGTGWLHAGPSQWPGKRVANLTFAGSTLYVINGKHSRCGCGFTQRDANKSRIIWNPVSELHGVSLAIWDHTMWLDTRHKRTHPYLNPSQ